MRNLNQLADMTTNIALGGAIIAIAGIAAMIVINARTTSRRDRREHAKAVTLACIALMAGWIWLYVTHLAP